MNILHDSGKPEDLNNRGRWSKTVEIDGHLFRMVLDQGSGAHYVIYRWSEAGEWEWIEAQGGTFAGENIDLRFTDVNYLNGGGAKANHQMWWLKLFTKCQTYAKFTKPNMEEKN